MCPSGALRAPRDGPTPTRCRPRPSAGPTRRKGPQVCDLGALSSLPRSSAPPVVLLETHGLAGAPTEDVRAVVLPVVVPGHRVDGGAGLLGRLDRDVPVAADARTPRDQPSP